MHKKPVKSAGFTLVEVIASLVVMVVLLGGVLAATLQARKLADSARACHHASGLINTRVEEVRAMPFDRVLALSSTPGRNQGEDVGPGGRVFQWNRSFAASGSGDLLKVIVVVSWNEPAGTRSVHAVTFVARHGIGNREVRFATGGQPANMTA